jgi:hypothetical protein
MHQQRIHKARVPMVLTLGLLGALASAACGGEADPNGKTGGGLDKAKGGSGGSGAAVGAGGSINVGQGGTSGSTSVGGTTSGSAGSAGSGGTVTDGTACAAVSRDSTKAEVALLFMVDISGSMNCPVPELSPPCEVQPSKTYSTTRWSEMDPALKAFFDSPDSANMWAGISFFSRNGSCTASDYEKPDSEIALLPAAAMNLDAVVDKQKPQGSTPTVPALQGALNHANDWATAHPDQSVVVVYATDGYPMSCDSSNTIANAATIAATAYAGPNKIRTYVLGVGPNLSDLNAIAMSGGTDQATQIDTGQDVTAQLTASFNEIRSAVAVECTYTVPAPPAGQTLDPNEVNVNYTSGSNPPVAVPFNNTATCDQGWQYTNGNKEIVLCGSTCDEVKADPNASIQVLFGCQTMAIGGPR